MWILAVCLAVVRWCWGEEAAVGDDWEDFIAGYRARRPRVVLDGVAVRLFFFQAEDGIRDGTVTGVQTCALPIWRIEAPDLCGSIMAHECRHAECRAQIRFAQARRSRRLAWRRCRRQRHPWRWRGLRCATRSHATRHQEHRKFFHRFCSSWLNRLNRCAIKAEPKKGAIRSTMGMAVRIAISRPAA